MFSAQLCAGGGQDIYMKINAVISGQTSTIASGEDKDNNNNICFNLHGSIVLNKNDKVYTWSYYPR